MPQKTEQQKPIFQEEYALSVYRLFVETVDEDPETMPNRNLPYYRTNDHHLERAFSAPTPSGESFSTVTTDTPIEMTNGDKRDRNGDSNALLLGNQTPHRERRRGLGNEYVSDATLLTTTSTVGIINETNKTPSRTKHNEDEARPHSVQTARQKRLKHPPHHLDEQPSACRLAFMVVGALILVFTVIFGTIYLIIHRMRILEQQQ